MNLSRKFLCVCFCYVCVAGVNAEALYLLTASEAGARAVRYDTALQSAYADLRLQYEALGLDIRNFFPSLAFDFGSNDTKRVQASDSHLMSISATLTQPLWDGGKALFSYIQKKMELEQSLKKLNKQACELHDRAVELFYATLVSEKKIRLQISLLELAEEQLRIIEKEVTLGVTTALEYRKAESTYRTLVLEKKTLEISTRLERLELVKLIHIDHEFVLEESQNKVRPMELLSADLLYQRAISASLELEALSWKIKMLQAQQNAFGWSFIPTVSLVAIFSTSTDELPFSEYTWSLGLQFGFTSGIFSMNGGMRYGKTSSNNAEFIEESGSGVPLQNVSVFLQPSYYANALKATVLEIENVRRDIQASVDEALERYRLACAQKKIVEETVLLMNEQYELVLAQKQLGLVKQIDVMNTALAVKEKTIDCIDADYAVLKAEREIEKLVKLEPGQLGQFFDGA